jgi:hypothetical protein
MMKNNLDFFEDRVLQGRRKNGGCPFVCKCSLVEWAVPKTENSCQDFFASEMD